MTEITGSSPVEPEEYLEQEGEEQEQDDEIVLVGEKRVSQPAYNVEEDDEDEDDYSDESDSEDGEGEGAAGSHINQQEQQQPQPIYTVEDEESDEYEVDQFVLIHISGGQTVRW
jgi:hypothetical protein